MNIDEAITQAEHELLLQPSYTSIKQRLALLRFVQAWDAAEGGFATRDIVYGSLWHGGKTDAAENRKALHEARAAVDEALK